jgi:hypothetical protein
MNRDLDVAVGGRSQAAHRTAIERMAHAGAVPTTALAVVPSYSATGRRPWPAKRARSSIGISPRSPG